MTLPIGYSTLLLNIFSEFVFVPVLTIFSSEIFLKCCLIVYIYLALFIICSLIKTLFSFHSLNTFTLISLNLTYNSFFKSFLLNLIISVLMLIDSCSEVYFLCCIFLTLSHIFLILCMCFQKLFDDISRDSCSILFLWRDFVVIFPEVISATV
jgi:hypothetical protein